MTSEQLAASSVPPNLTYPRGAMVQDRFAEGLLRTLIELAPQLVEGDNNYAARANFMWTTTWALNGMIGAGVPRDWASHFLEHVNLDLPLKAHRSKV